MQREESKGLNIEKKKSDWLIDSNGMAVTCPRASEECSTNSCVSLLNLPVVLFLPSHCASNRRMVTNERRIEKEEEG